MNEWNGNKEVARRIKQKLEAKKEGGEKTRYMNSISFHISTITKDYLTRLNKIHYILLSAIKKEKKENKSMLYTHSFY